jgi:hypothetical protein
MTIQTLDPVGAPRTRKEQLAEIASGRFFDKALEVTELQPSHIKRTHLFPIATELYGDEEQLLTAVRTLGPRKRLRRDIPAHTGNICARSGCTQYTTMNPQLFIKDKPAWDTKQLKKACSSKTKFDNAVYCLDHQVYQHSQAALKNCKQDPELAARNTAHLNQIRTWAHFLAEHPNFPRMVASRGKTRHYRWYNAVCDKTGLYPDDIIARAQHQVLQAGGRRTASGKVYPATSWTRLQEGGRYCAQRQMMWLYDNNQPFSLHLPMPKNPKFDPGFEAEYATYCEERRANNWTAVSLEPEYLSSRSPVEDTLAQWLRDSGLFSQVLSPERQDPQNCNVPSVTPHGLFGGFVQDLRIVTPEGQVFIIQIESLHFWRGRLLETVKHPLNHRHPKQKDKFVQKCNELTQLWLHYQACTLYQSHLSAQQRDFEAVLFIDTSLVQKLLKQRPTTSSQALAMLARASQHTMEDIVQPMLIELACDTGEVVDMANDLFQEHVTDADLQPLDSVVHLAILYQHCFQVACQSFSDEQHKQDRYLRRVYRQTDAEDLCLNELKLPWTP